MSTLQKLSRKGVCVCVCGGGGGGEGRGGRLGLFIVSESDCKNQLRLQKQSSTFGEMLM